MTTVLRASPRRFVSTPSVERIAIRAMRYLQSGFSIHLRGPAGTGKTTLALHLADLLSRPITLIYGDDESKSSDLIGAQAGYTRKKVVDNFIHSVMKVEDEVKHNWVDSRLTMACREGFTLVYDEFNRSRPEVNNVLLSALEEKLLVLPPSSNQTEYVRVNPNFRAILTSNPEEYCGVHGTQDALMDRLVTITMPEPDELTQQEILVQKTELDRAAALLITQLVGSFRSRTGIVKASGLRSGLVIAKVCQEHGIAVDFHDADFRELCSDVLLSRSGLAFDEASSILSKLMSESATPSIAPKSTFSLEQIPAVAQAYIAPEPIVEELEVASATIEAIELDNTEVVAGIEAEAEAIEMLDETIVESIEKAIAEAEANDAEVAELEMAESATTDSETVQEALTLTLNEQIVELLKEIPPIAAENEEEDDYYAPNVTDEDRVYQYLLHHAGVSLSDLEGEFGMGRTQVLDILRTLTRNGWVMHRDRKFFAIARAEVQA